MMRAVTVAIELTQPPAYGDVRLYGPSADLSGVDTTRPAAGVAIDAPPRHQAAAHQMGCFQDVVRYAGWQDGRHQDGAHQAEIASVLLDTREVEHGIVRYAAGAVTARGVAAPLDYGAVLVMSAPSTAADAALAYVGGAPQVSVEEWP